MASTWGTNTWGSNEWGDDNVTVILSGQSATSSVGSLEAFGYLKGPTDMLTYYENRYKNAIQQFAGMQLGRRRRDDYTDGTVRIPVKSPSP